MKIPSFDDIEKEVLEEIDEYKLDSENQFVEDIKALAKTIIKQNRNVKKFNDASMKSFSNIPKDKACEIVKNMGFSIAMNSGCYFLCKGVKPVKKDFIKEAQMENTVVDNIFIILGGLIALVALFEVNQIFVKIGLLIVLLTAIVRLVLPAKHVTIEDGIYVLKMFRR